MQIICEVYAKATAIALYRDINRKDQ